MPRLTHPLLLGLIGTFVLFGLLFAAFAVRTIGSLKACSAAGGIWARAEGRCIPPDCAATDRCGRRADPSARCPEVRIGDDWARVHFLLGEPAQRDAGNAWWPLGQDQDQRRIHASFRNGRLIGFTCPAGGGSP